MLVAFWQVQRLTREINDLEKGEKKKRFLSAVSPDGIVVQYDTIVALSERIITIKDDFTLCAPFIMDYVSNYAVDNGYTVYECYCPLFPTAKIEHVIIPELKLCFFTERSVFMDNIFIKIKCSISI